MPCLTGESGEGFAPSQLIRDHTTVADCSSIGSARPASRHRNLPMNEMLIQSEGGVEIATESFGDAADPALLLIMGAKASMLWWPDAFCRHLADAGRFVLRYDHRDTGRSTSQEPGTANYTLDHLADDAIAVLDAHGVDRAHVVGMSLGGVIGQILALDHAARVSGLTLIASTPLRHDGPDLPEMSAEILDHVLASVRLDYSNEAAVVQHTADGWRLMAGTAHPFDERAAHELATAEYRRARNPASVTNHHSLTFPDSYAGRLREVAVPTLVIHGTADPVLPFDHGASIAAAIPGTTLLALEATGHELHPADWPQIIEAIRQQSRG